MKLLVVNYHYFRESKYGQGIYPINKRNFSNQIENLSNIYKFLSLDDLYDFYKKESYPDENYCMITFDDGLKEQLLAYDILLKKGVPATFFVNTLPLINKKALDVHKLHYVRTKIEDSYLFDIIENYINLTDYNIIKEKAYNQYKYDSKISALVKYLINFVIDDSKKENIINSLFNNLISETEFINKTYMSQNEIKFISSQNSLGAHGHKHIPLSKLKNTDLEHDIKSNIDYLNNIGNCKVKAFAYPYGGLNSYKKNSFKVLKKHDIIFAFTMNRGFNYIENFKNNNRYYLNRVDTNDAPYGKLKSKKFFI